MRRMWVPLQRLQLLVLLEWEVDGSRIDSGTVYLKWRNHREDEEGKTEERNRSKFGSNRESF